MESGRQPLQESAADTELQAAQKGASTKQTAVWVVLLFDLILLPFLAFAPFRFKGDDFFSDQVSRWSLETSVFDWLLLCFLRDMSIGALILMAQRPAANGKALSLLSWGRRLACIVLLLGLWRLVELDRSQSHLAGVSGDAVVLPTIIGTTLTTIVLALAAHFLLKARESLDKAVEERARLSNSDAEAPADQDSEQYKSKLSYWQTLKVMKPYFWPTTGERMEVLLNRTRAISTWVFVIGSKVASLMAPLYLQKATNGVSDSLRSGALTMSQAVIMNLVIYAFLTFIGKALKEAQALVYIKVQQAAYIEISDQTFVHLHNLSLDWHLRKKMGNVVRSMDRGIQAAQQTMQYVFLYLLPTIGEGIAVVVVFVMHFNNLRLAAFAFLNLYAYAYVTVKITIWRKQFRTATTKHDNELHDRLTDSLVNFETIKYFTAEDYEARQYREAVSSFQKYSMATQASLSFLNVVQQFIINFALAGGMLIATIDVLAEHKDVGYFVAVNAYILNMFQPLSFLGTIYNMVINALVDMHNFGQLLAETSDVQDEPGAPELDLQPKAGTPILAFENVSFSYSSQPGARSIRGVSFRTERGGTTALVGSTGAGKTTITRLLFRFYDPVSGRVCLNGQDARRVTQKSLRGAIGMVPQDVVLFNSSIAHNIRYGRIYSATQQEVEVAAESAQLKEFIDQQVKGYETIVGERGLKLSGGEKQRLAIARCLVKNPPIVVLDEATSALDSQTEQLVQKALDRLGEARSVLAIAHRLSTIKRFDEILVLELGEIVERGTHAKLLEQPESRYAKMWKQQATGVEVKAEASEASTTIVAEID